MGVFQSKVAVEFNPLCCAKIGCGRKILSVDLTNKEIWNFPVEGVCVLNNCTYDEFEEKIILYS